MEEKMCFRSHELVVDYVKTLGLEDKDIYLLGHSLGTGVVVDYATKMKWKSQVTLVSPYLSIPRVFYNDDSVDNFNPKFQFNSLKKMKDIECKVNMIHGANDQLIPCIHSQTLHESIREDIRKHSPLIIVGDADHDNIIGKIDDNAVNILLS